MNRIKKFIKINRIELMFFIPMVLMFVLIRFYKPDPKRIKEQVDRDIKPYIEIRNHIDSLQRENDSLKIIIKHYEDSTRIR